MANKAESKSDSYRIFLIKVIEGGHIHHTGLIQVSVVNMTAQMAVADG